MKTIISRFQCNSVVPAHPESTTTRIDMNAVYSNEGANASFSKATPWGQLTMGIDRGTEAHDFFERGETYELVFRKVEKGQ